MKRFEWLGAAMLAAMVAVPVVGQDHGGHAPAEQDHGHVMGDMVEVPLRTHEGRLTVPVETDDGTTLEFIVSTGNSVTVFSKSGEARVGDSQIFLAGLPISTEGSQTVDDSSLTMDDGTVIDGILGARFFTQFDVLVDAPSGRLVLRKPGRAVEWDGVTLSEPVRIRLLHGAIITFNVELNGHTYPAMLDTGAASVVVNERVKTEASLDDEGMATLKVGGTTLTERRTVVRDLPLFESFSPNGDGFVLVGAPLALDCVISISYVRQQLRTCVR